METKTKTLAQRIMGLLEGYSLAYGTYSSAIPAEMKGGKLEIKSTATTVRKPVTLDLWKDHLKGDAPLGIIPIRDNDTCLWGCIDIDSYDVDHVRLLEQCRKEKLPLLICRSKSGGAHCFLFMAEPVPAVLMQERLRAISALLGYGDAEIFPKQKTVFYERGDLGSWLNMPYFGGDETDRYCFKDSGLAMTTEEFVYAIESLQQSEEFLTEQEFRKKPANDPDFGDGPPCMQHLAATGYPEGMRNKGLFALATFAKKKYGSNWIEVLERWNRELFHPPLPTSEIADIIKSHERKEYNYTCKEHPLAAHCNSSVCRTRKYGVGGSDDYPVISGLSVLETDPPIWFMDVGEYRLELSTDELQNYRMFHKVCMEHIFVCFRMMKQDSWMTIIGEAMKEMVKLSVSDEISRAGHFEEILEEFLVNRHKGESKEDLLLGRPWEDETAGRHYFRMKDLARYLDAAGYKVASRATIVARIRALKGGSAFFNVKNKGINVWWVPNKFATPAKASLPPIEKEPI